jgi:hypothetical protein
MTISEPVISHLILTWLVMDLALGRSENCGITNPISAINTIEVNVFDIEDILLNILLFIDLSSGIIQKFP